MDHQVQVLPKPQVQVPSVTNLTVEEHIRVIPQAQCRLEYGEGLERLIAISPDQTQQSNIYMCSVRIPPGAETTEVHCHNNTHTAIYIERGEVVVYYGKKLEHKVVAKQGEFIHIPPGVIHYPVNETEEDMVAIVSRTPANQTTTTFNIPLPEIPALKK
jgi:uncharacterized RmlC-like cupin family protein